MSSKAFGETCLVQHPNVLFIYLTFSDFNTAYPSKKVTHEYQLSLAFKTSYASLTSVFFVHVSFANILVVVFTRDSTGRSVLQKYSNLLPNLVGMINHCVFNTTPVISRRQEGWVRWGCDTLPPPPPPFTVHGMKGFEKSCLHLIKYQVLPLSRHSVSLNK